MPPKSEVSDKLDKLIAGQEELKAALDTSNKLLDGAVKRIADLEAVSASQATTIADLNGRLEEQEKVIAQLKSSLNVREQKERLLSIRLNNFPVAEDEEANSTAGAAALAAKVFNRVFKPVLETAINSGALDAMPTAARSITKLYRAGKAVTTTSNARPPPLVITFADPTVRLAILRFKRSSLPPPNHQEKEVGVKRFVITEDLTTPTYQLLRRLQEREEVEKIWTAGGVIHFTKKGETVVRKARDVFVSIEQILA